MVNQENDAVLITVRSWISNCKLPAKYVKSRQCKRLLGYANHFEKLFVDKETQLLCRKSKNLPEQICLPQIVLIEALDASHDHRLSGHPSFEKNYSFFEMIFLLAWNIQMGTNSNEELFNLQKSYTGLKVSKLRSQWEMRRWSTLSFRQGTYWP